MSPSRGAAAPRRKLCYEALHSRRAAASAQRGLLSQLWPDSEPSLAAQSLHSLLHSLHRLLGDAIGGAPPVVHTAEFYRINVRAGIAVDVAGFEALARQGDRHWHAGAWPTAGSYYREAITLYRGDLHAGTDDSAVVERERLRASYLVMLGRLADIARRDHDYSPALEYASLVLDPRRRERRPG